MVTNQEKQKYKFTLPAEAKKQSRVLPETQIFDNVPSLDVSAKYFAENLEQVVAEAIRYLFIEAVYKCSSSETEKGFCIVDKPEEDVFDDLLNYRFDEEKKRIKVQPKPPAKLYWTRSKRQELLEQYNELLPLTRRAKAIYRKLSAMEIKNLPKLLKKNFRICPKPSLMK